LEDFKACYERLYDYVKDLFQEREQILQSLRMETITNEEQKNYIDILRQTLENSILKNGINDLLNSQKLNYPHGTTNLDILVDVTLIRAECEKFRKELLKSQLTNERFSEEVEDLRKKIEDLVIKNNKQKEEIENLLVNLDEKDGIVVFQQEEAEKMLEELEILRRNNEILTKEVSALKAQNLEVIKERSELNRKNIELLNQV